MVMSIVQDVVNFLSPQPVRNASPIGLSTSPKELFTRGVEEEITQEQVLYKASERHELIEALKLTIVPGGNWLRNTRPSGKITG